MKSTRRLVLLVGMLLSSIVHAQTATPPVPPTPPVNHEFDFWLGEWDVFKNGTDTKIGDSRIESVADGHALLEHWQATTSTHNGKSLNSYDPHTKEWRQYWISSNGRTSLYKGGLVDGSMVMVAENFTAQGSRYLMRGTWTPNPDGTVRQHFEVSSDDGANWQTVFDGLYRRKAATPPA